MSAADPPRQCSPGGRNTKSTCQPIITQDPTPAPAPAPGPAPDPAPAPSPEPTKLGKKGAACSKNEACVSNSCSKEKICDGLDTGASCSAAEADQCISGLCGADGKCAALPKRLNDKSCEQNSDCLSGICSSITNLGLRCVGIAAGKTCFADLACRSLRCGGMPGNMACLGADGDPCSRDKPTACASGYCATSGLCSPKPLKGVIGDACQLDADCQSAVCGTNKKCDFPVALMPNFSPCASASGCLSGLCAVIPTRHATQTLCVPIADNAPCTSDAQCASASCSSTTHLCVPKPSPKGVLGDACQLDDDCESVLCGADKKCAAPRPALKANGLLCDADEECITGRCALEDPFTENRCLPLLAGDKCAADSDCKSSQCLVPFDATDSIKRCIADLDERCTTDGHCKSAYCNPSTLYCRPKPLPNLSICTDASDCLSDKCGPLEGAAPGSLFCLPLTEGESCTVNAQCKTETCSQTTNVCVAKPLLANFSPCSAGAQCDSGSCTYVFGSATSSMLCFPRPDGAACTSDGQCSLSCHPTARVCGEPLANLTPCTANEQCLSGLCDEKGSSQTLCIPLTGGQTCTSDAQCASTSCVSVSGVKTCKGALEERCSVDAFCASGHCVKGLCAATEPKPLELDEECADNEDCRSERCDFPQDSTTLVCMPSYGGKTCRADRECVSGQCGGGTSAAKFCRGVEGEYCGVISSFCMSDWCGGDGFCGAARKKFGQSCSADEQCASDVCGEDSKCALGTYGSLCVVNGDCESNTCTPLQGPTPVESTRYCTPPPVPNGVDCTMDVMCISGICGDGGVCLGVVAGGACTSNEACESELCGEGKCLGKEGALCSVAADCQSTLCDDATKNCLAASRLALDEECSSDGECLSERCGFALGEASPHATCLRRLGGKPCAVADDCASQQCAGTGADKFCKAQNGEACLVDSFCASATCTDGFCAAPLKSNFATCTADEQCLSNKCLPNISVGGLMCYPLAVNEDCTNSDQCSSGLCDGTTEKCLGAENEACSKAAECASFNCLSSGACGPRLRTLGEACSTSSQCASTSCQSGVCSELLALGSACMDDSHGDWCQSGTCRNGQCSVPLTKNGEYCSASSQCESTSCQQNACDDLRKAEEPCALDDWCDTSMCVNQLCANQRGAGGAACTLAADCESGLCSNNVCYGAPKSNGEACSTGSQCSSGFCASDTTCADAPLKELNEMCAKDSECKSGHCGVDSTCTDSPTLKNNDDTCAFDTECISAYCDNSVNQCRDAPNLDLGESCSKKSQCASKFCEAGQCAALKAIGESCESPDACESNYCSTISGTCAAMPLKDDGAMCRGNDECASDVCDVQSNQCVAQKGINEQCDASTQCQSGYCSEGTCLERPPPATETKKAVGDACDASSECQSGLCRNSVCTIPKTKVGEHCDADSQCDFGCMNYKCMAQPGVPGDACDADWGCWSGICQGGTCRAMDGDNCTAASGCSTYSFCYYADSCMAKKPTGDGCDSDDWCGTGLCENGTCRDPTGTDCYDEDNAGAKCFAGSCADGVCAAPSPTLQDFARCSADADCSSGYCDAFQCKVKEFGSACSSDAQCKSKACGTDGTCKLKFGEDCSSSDQCSAALYCNDSQFCGTREPDGSMCGTDSRKCASGLCRDQTCRIPTGGACIRPDDTQDSCFSTLCGYDSKCAPLNVPAKKGEQCSANADCASSTCTDNTCALAAIGGPCSQSEDCGSNVCDQSIEQCIAPSAADGEACTKDGGCQSGYCLDSVCRLKTGRECGMPGSAWPACFSGRCSGESGSSFMTCTPLSPKADIGDACSANEDCSSSSCVNRQCQVKTKAIGETCSSNSECASSICEGDSTRTCRRPGGATCTGAMDDECSADSYCNKELNPRQCKPKLQLRATCFNGPECASGMCRNSDWTCRTKTTEQCSTDDDCFSGSCKVTSKVCRGLDPLAGDGFQCSATPDCIDGYDCVDRTCRARPKNVGEVCSSNAECSTELCQGSPSRTCRRPDNASCSGGASECSDESFCDTGAALPQCKPRAGDGGQCSATAQCLDGLVCKNNTCGEPVWDVGHSCEHNGQCLSTYCEPDSATCRRYNGATCFDTPKDSECATGSYCDKASSSWVCKGRAGPMGYCGAAMGCVDGYFCSTTRNQCMPNPRDVGASCSADGEGDETCKSTFCDSESGPAVCKLREGVQCTSNSECGTGFYCPAGAQRTCTRQLQTRDTCVASSDCASSLCRASDNTCRLPTGTACVADQQCFSTSCGTQTNQCSPLQTRATTGAQCSAPADCQSGYYCSSSSRCLAYS
jgi:hypothetical protein